jgi:hypothetical protein
MRDLAAKLGLRFFGESRPTARDRTSPRDAEERKIDAARTPMRHFFAGADLPDWQLLLVECVLCDIKGMALPGAAYQVQARLDTSPPPRQTAADPNPPKKLSPRVRPRSERPEPMW